MPLLLERARECAADRMGLPVGRGGKLLDGRAGRPSEQLTRMSSFEVPATFAGLLFDAARPVLGVDDVLLISVPFECAEPCRRRYRHKPGSPGMSD